MPTTDAELAEIPREECVRLLASQVVGRFAVCENGGPPLVVPVNYVLDGEVVVFRSDPGTKVRLLRQAPVSFEVDSVNVLHQTGWSVLVQGIAYEATHWETEHIGVQPWTKGAKEHWVRIVPSSITGRRIEPPDTPADRRGYL